MPVIFKAEWSDGTVSHYCTPRKFYDDLMERQRFSVVHDEDGDTIFPVDFKNKAVVRAIRKGMKLFAYKTSGEAKRGCEPIAVFSSETVKAAKVDRGSVDKVVKVIDIHLEQIGSARDRLEFVTTPEEAGIEVRKLKETLMLLYDELVPLVTTFEGDWPEGAEFLEKD